MRAGRIGVEAGGADRATRVGAREDGVDVRAVAEVDLHRAASPDAAAGVHDHLERGRGPVRQEVDEALVVQLDGGEGETRVLADRLARLAMGGEVGDGLRRAKTWGGEGVA